MADRKPIKQAHERAQVALFLQWFNARYRTNFSVVEEPDPPEAIIRSGRTTRWVEVTDAFWSDAFAKDEYSYATPGEVHEPIGTGPFLNPDEAFSKRFVDAVRKKLEKRSYEDSRGLYGPGYLVVPIMYPLFDANTIRMMRELWSQTRINDLGCFRSVYMTLRMGRGPVQRWSAYGRTSLETACERQEAARYSAD